MPGGFDAARNSFVQSFGSRALDASVLLIPQVGFLPADDPRVVGTVAAVERELLVDGLLSRYDTATGADGLPPGEGAFLACSFWLADAYAMQGRRRKRGRCSTGCWRCATISGCFRRNTIRRSRRLLGNFPQGFSHAALVGTAFGSPRRDHRTIGQAPDASGDSRNIRRRPSSMTSTRIIRIVVMATSEYLNLGFFHPRDMFGPPIRPVSESV